ncbi:MAG: DUF418 domain-containing protein [Akkermansiaceae bacterium]
MKTANRNLRNDRIDAIDVLRGVAVLGILLINIRSFAMPDIALSNPSEFGSEGSHNRFAYNLTYVLAKQKFMAIFSMLFGASVLLFTDRLLEKRKGVWSFFVRNGWLVLFGLAHLILIWSGDVLLIYGLCAFPLFFLRKLAPRWHLGLGVVVFLIPLMISGWIQKEKPHFDGEGQELFYSFWHPEPSALEANVERHLGDYSEQVAHRWEYESDFGSTREERILTVSLWGNYSARSLGMMLIGMALYRWGVFGAKLSALTYRRMAWWGLGMGIPLCLIGLEFNLYHGWDWRQCYYYGRIGNFLGTAPVALGYIGLVMLWCQSSWMPRLKARLTEVGRTALSCYIGQSLIATFLFYGFGLGLYGKVDYLLQLVFVVGIWLLQIGLVWFWMKRFRYGPLEWLWRCLTYLRWQPLRKEK